MEAGIKFSIIVPAYNVEKYLRRCLDSLTRQVYPAHEILVLNDGSTDTTPEIAKEYSEKYANVHFYSHENRGLGATRNRGVELAAGDYILFVDSDDYVSHELLAACAEKLAEKSYDAVFFEHEAVEDDSAFGDAAPPLVLERGGLPERAILPDGRDELEGDDTERMLTIQVFAVWFGAYRRGMLLKNDIKNGEGYFIEDQEFAIDAILSSSKIGLIYRPLYSYCRRPSSIVQTKTDEHLGRLLEGQKKSIAAVLRVLEKHHASAYAASQFLNRVLEAFVYACDEGRIGRYLEEYTRHIASVLCRYAPEDRCFLRDELRAYFDAGIVCEERWTELAGAVYTSLLNEKQAKLDAYRSILGRGRQATLSRWYFDLGDGLSEVSSLGIEYPLGDGGEVDISVTVPAGCVHLRWDPCDMPCIVSGLRIFLENGNEIEPAVISGLAVSGKLFFDTDDPWILINVEKYSQESFTLHVSAKLHRALDSAVLAGYADALRGKEGRKHSWVRGFGTS